MYAGMRERRGDIIYILCVRVRVYPRDAGECVLVACTLHSTLKMISKVNDVPRFEQSSPWKRWPASLPVMIDLLRSDCEGDGSISEIDREWSLNLRGYLYKALIFSRYALRVFNTEYSRFGWRYIIITQEKFLVITMITWKFLHLHVSAICLWLHFIT